MDLEMIAEKLPGQDVFLIVSNGGHWTGYNSEEIARMEVFDWAVEGKDYQIQKRRMFSNNDLRALIAKAVEMAREIKQSHESFPLLEEECEYTTAEIVAKLIGGDDGR